MSRYRIGGNFRVWKKGDLLEKYEYNRLPIEMKVDCVEVPDEVPAPVAVVAEVAPTSRFAKKVVESDNA